MPPAPSPPAARLEAALTHAWQTRGALACALLPLSWLFGALSTARAALYRGGLLASTRLPVPVVVVGNIFVGGTGKTPLTIWLAEALRAAGMRPGVISRGHGRAGAAPRAVTAASSAAEVGDEPLLIARRAHCPVFVARARVQAAQALLAAHPEVDVIISDDGLQHYAMARDVEIVLFDARGVGNGWLLPAGPLRERPARRRDFTVVNSAAPVAAMGAHAYPMLLAGSRAERLQDRAQSIGLAELAAAGQRGQRLLAAAGIGNPERFFAMLRAAGLAFEALPLPDHHDFLDRPFDGLDADLILITEKDAVKCGQLDHLKNDPRLWVVPVSAQLDGALAQQIVEKCRGRKAA